MPSFREIRSLTILLAFGSLPFLTLAVTDRMLSVPRDHAFFWVLRYLPHVLLASGAVFALRLNQTRAFAAIAAFELCYAAAMVSSAGLFPLFDTAGVLLVATTAVPIAVALIMVSGEGGLWSLRGLAYAASIGVPAAVLALVAHSQPSLFTGIEAPLAYGRPFFFSLVGLGTTVAAIAVLILVPGLEPRPFSSALGIALVVSQFAAAQVISSGAEEAPMLWLAMGFNSISLMFTYAVYRMYWEKAYLDQLTEVSNRRALEERLRRLPRNYSVAMIDIDFFKAFNDLYGHNEGDNVLRYVAKSLQRRFDHRVYRFGGEEFCVLFEHVGPKTAARGIDKVRQHLCARDFRIRADDETRKLTSERDRGNGRYSGPRLRVTFSAGVAARDNPREKPQDVIEQADTALYMAKRHGRNRVLCYGDWHGEVHAFRPIAS
ncbi:MAG: diguanylate cyclase [Chitinivibrionales bacterium]|nr:diguanylate cyclase [Chitinivibrionales bacterium]MBD3395667.1 diguanylate cyclase [Chitinivibrionales bacterium]